MNITQEDQVDGWVRARFRERFCDKNGKQIQAVNFDKLKYALLKSMPGFPQQILASVTHLSNELYDLGISSQNLAVLKDLINKLPIGVTGHFIDSSRLKNDCNQICPSVHPRRLDELIANMERENVLRSKRQSSSSMANLLRDTTEATETVQSTGSAKKRSPLRESTPTTHAAKRDFSISSGSKSTQGLECSSSGDVGISNNGFRSKRPKTAQPNYHSVASDSNSNAQLNDPGFYASTTMDLQPEPRSPRAREEPGPVELLPQQGPGVQETDDLLSRKLKQLQNIVKSDQYPGSGGHAYSSLSAGQQDTSSVEADLTDRLIPEDSTQESSARTEDDFDVRHAPLVSGDIVNESSTELLPQTGFLGMQGNAKTEISHSKVFTNSNVPFSTFICGVQGSGKSHTAACFLENAVMPPQRFGRSGQPLSALVFSYGEFSSVGSGFSVSEAAFLGSVSAAFPDLPPVSKINVLVSSTNMGIKKIYERLPNVTVSAFKLKPWLLDIGTILTFMNFNGDQEGPLYMAHFNNLLREMATQSNGIFDYRLLQRKLQASRFDHKQQMFLDMRLKLLESFLDLRDEYPDPQYNPGEITIIDMSCPFIDASTACTLFKLGLQRYLQSQAPGKLVVLDEAHKYMLNVPGAKALNEALLTTIRLQRHYGARVIISTQEPTLLTSLIALCSVVVIHRFTSPEWFAALKKHINIPSEASNEVLRAIEQLRTGTALVYSSNSVLGRNADGTLDKGAGRLVVMKMRKRITADGGQSVLCQ